MSRWHYDPDPVVIDKSDLFSHALRECLSLISEWGLTPQNYKSMRGRSLLPKDTYSAEFIVDMIRLAGWACWFARWHREAWVPEANEVALLEMPQVASLIPKEWHNLLSVGSDLDAVKSLQASLDIVRSAISFILKNQDNFNVVTGPEFQIQARKLMDHLLFANECGTMKVGEELIGHSQNSQWFASRQKHDIIKMKH